jgi:hypothetical protein
MICTIVQEIRSSQQHLWAAVLMPEKSVPTVRLF